MNESEERAALIRHDLRTPLTAILGYSGLILDETQTLKDQTAAGLLRKITQTGKIVGELINRIVDGGGRAIALNEILESNNQILGFVEMLKGCDLTAESCQDVDAIMAACGKLEDLVRHLLNAIR